MGPDRRRPCGCDRSEQQDGVAVAGLFGVMGEPGGVDHGRTRDQCGENLTVKTSLADRGDRILDGETRQLVSEPDARLDLGQQS
jgi:hypothetical protein